MSKLDAKVYILGKMANIMHKCFVRSNVLFAVNTKITIRNATFWRNCGRLYHDGACTVQRKRAVVDVVERSYKAILC